MSSSTTHETVSARIVVQLTPTDRRRIEQRARKVGRTLSGYIRQRALDDEDEQFGQLLDELERRTAAANTALDAALSAVQRVEEDYAQMTELRAIATASIDPGAVEAYQAAVPDAISAATQLAAPPSAGSRRRATR